MFRKKQSTENKAPGARAQAIVEFAIALPILLAVLIGIFEVGRYVFIYSGVTNASRSASRYASAVGLTNSVVSGDTNYYHKYVYCAGITKAATEAAFLVPSSNLTVDISYTYGANTINCDAASGEDTDVLNAGITTGDRVTVVVTASYSPILKLLPIQGRDIVSTSSRTILGIVDLK